MEQGFPTEEDRVNCPFYFRIGSCRNGDRCNRIHNRPSSSQVLLLPHLYPATPDTMLVSNDDDWTEDVYNKAQDHMEIFFEEIFLELAQYGEIEDLVVCDNVSDHMVGNVYVKFFKEEAAEKALISLQNRFYGSRLITAEYSPVTDFREARCKAFHENRCTRGGACNFMHIKHCPKAIKKRIVKQMYEEHPEFQGKGAESDAPKAKKRKEGSRRMPSEERKALISQWNKERLAAMVPGAPPPPAAPPAPMVPPPPPGAPKYVPVVVPPAH